MDNKLHPGSNHLPLSSLSTPRKKTSYDKYSVLAVIILIYLATFLFILAPGKDNIPFTFFSIISFFGVQVFCRNCRPNLDTLIIPLNLAYLFFFIQLVIVPLTIAYFGIAPSILPRRPSTESMNIGLALYTLAYFSFSLSVEFFSHQANKKSLLKSEISLKSEIKYPGIPINLIASAFVIIGLIGFFLLFGNLETFVSYLKSPISRLSISGAVQGTISGALSGLFRPFLSFGIVLLWANWIDKNRSRSSGRKIALVTALAISGLGVAGLTFSFNRASVIVPLISLIAAFYLMGERLSILKFIFLLLASIVLFWFLGNYRNIDNLDYQGLSPLSSVQVYGNAPQYIGYFLEETAFGRELSWGKTLFASAMSPVPVLGKDYRSFSGVTQYNYLIYRNNISLDLIFPLQAELFANFHFPGVLIGYSFLGWIIYKLDRAFKRSHNSFESYGMFVISYWFCYSVLGSMAILSQQLIVAFWPYYIYIVIKFINFKLTKQRTSI